MFDDSLDDLFAKIDDKTLSESTDVSANRIEPKLKLEPSVSASQPFKQPANEPPTKKLKSHNSLLVNVRQKGNPLLRHIQKSPWEFADIVPDYEMGPQVAAMFVSLKYHSLNPDYLHGRLKSLGKSYNLRVLIVFVDISNPYGVLKTLTKISILADLTLMLAWSDEEAANILEIYKMYENKPADRIRRLKDSNHYDNMVNALASIKPVNKTDATMLLTRYKSLANIIKCSAAELEEIPGFGRKKAQVLSSVLGSNFLVKKADKKKSSGDTNSEVKSKPRKT